MDVAASFITVVTLALRSTQVIYNTVSGFKNAPKTIKQMTSSLLDLSKLLEQLRDSSGSLHLAADLPDLISRCAENLRVLERKLGKLSLSTGKGAGRFWKNVKLMLQEKDLDRMSDLVRQHVEVLSLQLNILEGYACNVKAPY